MNDIPSALDNFQSTQTLKEWFTMTGMKEIEVFRAGLVMGRGVG